MPEMPAFKRQRHEDHSFEVGLNYVVGTCLK